MPEDRARTPRWVKAFAAVAVLVLVVFVVFLIAGRGGGHGPGRHAPAEDPAHTGPPSGITHPQP